jgi:hypothetical protein
MVDGHDDAVMQGDLIRRSALLDMADAKVIFGTTATRVIKNAPAVDAVEVVRCKDCKWYQEGKLLAPNKFCFRLKHPKEDRKIGYNYAPDDFCSYGERRDDEICKKD